MPRRNIEALRSPLVDGRNVGRPKPAGFGHDRQRLDLAATHIRERVRRHVAHDVDLSGHQVLDRGGAAAIGRELKVGSGVVLNVDPERCDPLPAPTVAADAFSGFALSHAMSSFRSFAGKFFLATTQSGVSATRATGSKSVNMS